MKHTTSVRDFIPHHQCSIATLLNTWSNSLLGYILGLVQKKAVYPLSSFFMFA